MSQDLKTSSVAIEGLNDSALKVRLKRNLEIIQNVLENPTTVIGLIIVILMLLMALILLR